MSNKTFYISELSRPSVWNIIDSYNISGAPTARRAANRSPISKRKQKETHDFLVVIMASGVARGRVRTTAATVESRNMAAVLQIIGWQRYVALAYCVLLSGHPCYDQLPPVKTRYPLTSITWAYRGLKLTAHRDHVFFEVDRWPGAGFSIGSRAHVWLTC